MIPSAHLHQHHSGQAGRQSVLIIVTRRIGGVLLATRDALGQRLAANRAGCAGIRTRA
jgi:hypothetical protein